MVNSDIEMNEIIPNIELIFYKMFMSPITTRDEKLQNQAKDILAGNLFTEFEMPVEGFISLLETIALNPKKKHLKKIIQYVRKTQKAENVDAEVIDMITFAGID